MTTPDHYHNAMSLIIIHIYDIIMTNPDHYVHIMSHCQSKFNLITLSYVPTYLNSNYLGFKFGLPLHLAIGLI